MKLFADFRRWTTTKAALAVAGLLAIGGAVGSALAISPTVPAPIKWLGGVPSIYLSFANAGTLFQVPAGQNFMLTDLIVSNSTGADSTMKLYVSTAADCAVVSQIKLWLVHVPANSNLVLPLVTGVGFSAGQRICISGNGVNMQANARGFLFTAAPAT